MMRVIVPNALSNIPIPSTELSDTAPSVDFGNGDNLGEKWPTEGAAGNHFTTIPPVPGKRCSKQERLARLREAGGNEHCEDAVVRTLDWLKNHQNSDGSWTGANQSAMTGFALLAFLGHCETPLSNDYGDSVLRAITYLVNVGMKSDGKLTTRPAGKSWPYEHAIATYALAEATTFCKADGLNLPELFAITQKAGQIIIGNQHLNSGGWDYAYDTHSPRGGDLSITAWQVQALIACQHTGLSFDGLSRATSRACTYITSLQSKDGGFAYANANENPHASGYRTMTGGAVLCLQMSGKGSGSAARRGIKYIGKHSKFDYLSEFSDLYAHYYESQALLNRGGAEWQNYNAMFRDQLLTLQNSDGSWPPPGGGKPLRAVAAQYTTNLHYRNCLNALMLEVYYRFLPSSGSH